MEDVIVTKTGMYHGGLVFFGYPDNPLDQLVRVVSATLEDYGHPVERQSVMSEQDGYVLSSDFLVRVALEPCKTEQDSASARSQRLDQAAGLRRSERAQPERPRTRVSIEVSAVEPGSEDSEITELMLVVMLYRMVDVFSVDHVEWLDRSTKLPVADFLSAFSNVSPRRVRGRQEIVESPESRFGSVDETAAGLAEHYDAILGHAPHSGKIGLIDLSDEESLAMAFREHPHPKELGPEAFDSENQNDVRRLAAWGMTGMMVFLSAPVAASMAAVNIARGEDFRLNTHVLSLTGFLVVLQSSGALASVVNAIP
jgi:hypothetical protein